MSLASRPHRYIKPSRASRYSISKVVFPLKMSLHVCLHAHRETVIQRHLSLSFSVSHTHYSTTINVSCYRHNAWQSNHPNDCRFIIIATETVMMMMMMMFHSVHTDDTLSKQREREREWERERRKERKKDTNLVFCCCSLALCCGFVCRCM